MSAIGLNEIMFSLRLSTGKKNKVYLPEPPFPHAEVSVSLPLNNSTSMLSIGLIFIQAFTRNR